MNASEIEIAQDWINNVSHRAKEVNYIFSKLQSVTLMYSQLHKIGV